MNGYELNELSILHQEENRLFYHNKLSFTGKFFNEETLGECSSYQVIYTLSHEMLNGNFKVKPEYISKFKDSFITLGEIMKLTQKQGQTLVKELASYGVIAKTGPKIDGGTGYLFIRSEVLPVLPLL
ncbi:hypothetical protein ACFQI7_32585 [Paenibacillus allorhizosphaerae]|uniref:Uncharacterized protein n=1 Tax=Paenibacillus allorhizosphaerae TaxID=2849866 RepID=A0ABM8VUY9_9BACL|nr:hypothetical protein [Paenibacillus allorhizosphaerae]CAG7659126.1 hypothetical protein PAECIP111802_07395 [Paenibacillus allorhizosphaerae]